LESRQQTDQKKKNNNNNARILTSWGNYEIRQQTLMLNFKVNSSCHYNLKKKKLNKRQKIGCIDARIQQTGSSLDPNFIFP
jgi:hypothetical protein